MCNDEKPSGNGPAREVDDDIDQADQTAGRGAQGKTKHKVIADIHSGMVLVAPVASEPDAEDPEEEDEPGDEAQADKDARKPN